MRTCPSHQVLYSGAASGPAGARGGEQLRGGCGDDAACGADREGHLAAASRPAGERDVRGLARRGAARGGRPMDANSGGQPWHRDCIAFHPTFY